MVAAPVALPRDGERAGGGGDPHACGRPRGVRDRDDERLVGVVTRKTLVREVVAKGLDPRTTELGSFAEPPLFTLESTLPLDEAFRELEQHDLERVPVVEGGRLVGVLSRAVLQRRLAEDEPPAEPVEVASAVAAGEGARRGVAFGARRERGGLVRGAVEDVVLAHLERVEAEEAERLAGDDDAAEDHGRALRLETGDLAPLGERQRGEPLELRVDRRRGDAVAVDALRVVDGELEVERGERRDRARRRRSRGAGGRAAPPARAAKASRTAAAQRSSSSAVGGSDARKRSVSRTEPTSKLWWKRIAVRVADDELGRAAADVHDDERLGGRRPAGDAAERQQRLLVAGEEPRREAVAPLDLAEERLAVLRVADRARRDQRARARRRAPPPRAGTRRGSCGRGRSGRGGGCAARRRPRRGG